MCYTKFGGAATHHFPTEEYLSDIGKLHIATPLASILGAALVVLMGVGAVYTLIRDAKKDHMELVAALSKNSQEVALLKIIDDRVDAPMETKVNMTRTIITMAGLKRLDIALICGIIHVETGGTWKTSLVSPVGAVGIMQVMPATGKAYLRAERIDPTSQTLIDPVNNIICGIGALADFHDQAIDSRLDKDGKDLTVENFGVTLTMYNQGPKSRAITTYSKDVIAATKKYRELGV